MGWERAAFNRLVKIIKRGKESRAQGAILWVGAGLSVSAGYPTWGGLAEGLRKISNQPLAAELTGTELIDAFVAANGKGDFDDALATLFPERKHLPQHENLVALPWERIVTTNYDELLEGACRERGFDYLTITLNQNLDILAANKLPVIKAHGSLSDYGSIILDSKSYRQYAEKYPQAVADLESRLRKHSIVFFGCSMTDPRLTEWLQRLGPDGRDHLKSSAAVLTEGDWEKLPKAEQALLREAHIEEVLVRGYEDIPKLIEELCRACGVETAGATAGGSGGTGGIGFLAKLCDRKPHVSHVMGALPGRQQEVRPPYVFLLYSHERQSPDSLVERLSRVDIRRTAARFWDISHFHPSSEIPWPLEADVKLAPDVLLANLFEALGVSEWDGKIDQAARLLCQAYRGRPKTVRCCHHTIEAAGWNCATAALISRYLRFWEEVQQLEPQTSFIIFLKLVYGGWRRFVPFLRRKRQLRRLCEGSPVFRGVVPKLGSVGREEVRSWLREQGLTPPRAPGELVKEWFGLRPMGLPMEVVESRITATFASRREGR